MHRSSVSWLQLKFKAFHWWLSCCGFLLSCVYLSQTQSIASTMIRSKKVAVIGGGFAGLATAYRLSEIASSLDVFDFKAPGQAGASSAAGGLLHPLSPRGGFIWHGLEGYHASKQLLHELTQRKEVKTLLQDEGESLYDFPKQGILRPIFKPSDLDTWRKAMTLHSDWLEEVDHQPIHANNALGVFQIKQAIVVNSPLYLKALWTSIQGNVPDSNWAQVPIQNIDFVKRLAKQYDVVVIAAGAGLQQLWTSADDTKHRFVVKYVKGENIFYPNDEKVQPLADPLLSGEYIVPRSKGDVNYLICGATHDHLSIPSDQLLPTLQDLDQQPSTAMLADSKLRQHLHVLYPKLHEKEPFGYNAGIRLVTERTNLGKIPIVGRHPELSNVWTLAGLGARGLVYHAAMANYLKQAIELNDEGQIPAALHPSAHYARSN